MINPSAMNGGDDLINRFRLDRSSFSSGSLQDGDRDVRGYWHARTPHERLLYMEYLRRLNYGTSRATERLQRVLELVEPSSS